jgi:hypothetical protein
MIEGMNWPVFAAVVGVISILALLPTLIARNWTAPGFVVALANLVVVLMNAPAPLKGIIDPANSAYRFGVLQSEGGVVAAVMGGAVTLGALLSAFLVLRNGRGISMLALALVDGFLALNIGVPVANQLISQPEEATIKFGQYLTLPPPVAIPLLFFIFVVPFAGGALIGLSRLRK